MSITLSTKTPLGVLPADAFNADGIAVVVATGTKYDGAWLINIRRGPELMDVIGSVWTGATDDPHTATSAALGWLRDECSRLGLKIAGLKNLNDQYGPDERPYFTTSQVCIVDKDWT